MSGIQAMSIPFLRSGLALGLALAAILTPSRTPFSLQAANAAPSRAVGELDLELGISALPGSVEEFVALRDRLATTPQGAVAVFLVALDLYATQRVLGISCLTVAVDASHVKEGQGPGSYKGKIIDKNRLADIDRVLANSPATAVAYWKGAAPGNGYAPTKPYAISLYMQKGTRGQLDKYAMATSGRTIEEWKLFVRSEGYRNAAGGGRPISVAQNAAGLWKVTRFKGVVAPVMKARSSAADDL